MLYLFYYWKDFFMYPIETFWEFKTDADEDQIALQTFIFNILTLNFVLGFILAFTNYPSTSPQYYLTFSGKVFTLLNGFFINGFYFILINLFLFGGYYFTVKLFGIDLYLYEIRNMVYISTIVYLIALILMPIALINYSFFGTIRFIVFILQVFMLSFYTFLYNEEDSIVDIIKYIIVIGFIVLMFYLGIIALLSLLKYLPVIL